MLKSGELSDYDSPSWAYKQADQVGFNRALNAVIKLCKVHSDKE